MRISKKIVSNTIALALVAGIGAAPVSEITNTVFDTVSANASENTIDLSQVTYLPSGQDTLHINGGTYTMRIDQDYPPYCGMYVNIAYDGTFELKASSTSSELNILLADNSGNIVAYLNFGGSSSEPKTAKISLQKGKYHAIVVNNGVNQDEDIEFSLNDAEAYDIGATNNNEKLLTYTVSVDKSGKTIEHFTYNGKTIVEGIDFKKTKNTTDTRNSGVRTFNTEIEGIGTYYGTISCTYNLLTTSDSVEPIERIEFTKANISDAVMVNNSPTFTVKYNGILLKEGIDYTLTIKASDNKQGDCTYRTFVCNFTGKGSYAGNQSITLENILISDTSSQTNKINIANCTVTPTTNNGKITALTVKYGNTILKEGTDYTKTAQITGSTATNKNYQYYTYKYVLTGIGKYNGTYTVTGKTKVQVKFPLKFSTHKLNGYFGYTGKPIKPADAKGFFLSGIIDGKIVNLKKNVDYTVSYKNNTKVGAATMIIKGKGKYTGTWYFTFKISRMKVKSIKTANLSRNYKYTGKAIKPSVKWLKLSNGKKLVKGTDYTVTYKNNRKVGTGKIIITFKGNYTGKVVKTFK